MILLLGFFVLLASLLAFSIFLVGMPFFSVFTIRNKKEPVEEIYQFLQEKDVKFEEIE